MSASRVLLQNLVRADLYSASGLKLVPFVLRTGARLRQGKPGKGGKRCKKHRRNLSEEPSGPRAHPVESGQQPEASLASWRGDPPGEA